MAFYVQQFSYTATLYHENVTAKGFGPTITAAFNAAVLHYITLTESDAHKKYLQTLAETTRAARRGISGFSAVQIKDGKSFARVDRT